MLIQFINLKEERWVKINKFIEDALDKYEISDNGRVRIDGSKIMRNQFTGRYEVIGLNHKDNTRHQYYVHRLVTLAFIENNNSDRIYVNHKEGRLKTWNHVDNLEWVTAKENTVHSYENQLQPVGVNHHKNKYPEGFIREICSLLESGLKPRFILKELGIMNNTKEYKRIKRLIKHISMKNQWTHISKDYDF